MRIWKRQTEQKMKKSLSGNLNPGQKVRRSVIGGLASQKKIQIWSWPPSPQLNTFKENHLHYIVVVVHQIPAGVCQIQQNPSVLGENSSASAFTFPWGSIIGCNLMLSIRLSLKSRGMWRKFYQAQGEWTTSPHSTVIVDQNWNAPLFNSTFCQNCTNFEAWLLTITFARKFDRLIIKGVWKIILEIWNSSQNMATSLLWARFSCHFVNVMPVFEETTWEGVKKRKPKWPPFIE